MAYTTKTLIETLIAPQHLIDALDDDSDGVIDDGLLDAVIAVASTAVDDLLSARYTVPFTTVPAAVERAALILACEAIYARRLEGDQKNKFTPEANRIRDRFERIAKGELTLDAGTETPNTPGAVISEDVDLDGSLR